MDLQKICEAVIEETEAVLGCPVFDLATGLMLASASRPDSALEEADINDALRTGAELFRGRFADRFVQSLATGLISTRGFVQERHLRAQIAEEMAAKQSQAILNLLALDLDQRRDRLAPAPPRRNWW